MKADRRFKSFKNLHLIHAISWRLERRQQFHVIELDQNHYQIEQIYQWFLDMGFRDRQSFIVELSRYTGGERGSTGVSSLERFREFLTQPYELNPAPSIKRLLVVLFEHNELDLLMLFKLSFDGIANG